MVNTGDRIKVILFAVIAEITGIPADKVAMESRFLEDMGYDSLDAMETVVDLEESLNIEIEDTQIEKLRTVKEAYDYLITLPIIPQEESLPTKRFFTGTLVEGDFIESSCAELEFGNEITMTISEYSNRERDNIFPEILKNFKDKKVLITIEIVKK